MGLGVQPGERTHKKEALQRLAIFRGIHKVIIGIGEYIKKINFC